MTLNKNENTNTPLRLNPDFLCPISQGYFHIPVKTECNHVFEKESIEKWMTQKQSVNADQKPSCPLCKQPIQNLKEDIETKNATENFLYANLSHLPSRNLNSVIAKNFNDSFRKQKDDECIKLLSENPHLVFYSHTNYLFIRNLLLLTPLEIIKKYFDEIKKIPGLEKLALMHPHKIRIHPDSNHQITIYGLCYCFSMNDINKFEFILSFFNNDLTEFKKYQECLSTAATTKSLPFFTYIFDLFKDEARAFLLANRIDGKNTLMVACSQSTSEIVDHILEFLKNEKNIMPFIANDHHFDILACAASNPVFTEGLAITKKLEAFLKDKLSPEEFNSFNNYTKKRNRYYENNKLVGQLNKIQTEMNVLKKELIEIKRQRTSPFPMPLFVRPEVQQNGEGSARTRPPEGEPSSAPLEPTTSSQPSEEEENEETQTIQCRQQ